MLVQNQPNYPIQHFTQYVVYIIWNAFCSPIVTINAALTAFFFGDYVTKFFDGIDFCQNSILAWTGIHSGHDMEDHSGHQM